MNFHFVWKTYDAATGEIEGMYEQTIYGEDLTDAVSNFSAMHGELGEDSNGYAMDILSIKEVQE